MISTRWSPRRRGGSPGDEPVPRPPHWGGYQGRALRRSSSGRVDPRGSTTASATVAPNTTPPLTASGSSSDWHPRSGRPAQVGDSASGKRRRWPSATVNQASRGQIQSSSRPWTCTPHHTATSWSFHSSTSSIAFHRSTSRASSAEMVNWGSDVGGWSGSTSRRASFGRFVVLDVDLARERSVAHLREDGRPGPHMSGWGGSGSVAGSRRSLRRPRSRCEENRTPAPRRAPRSRECGSGRRSNPCVPGPERLPAPPA